ncbi:MAG: nucleotide sugar dehydrogenase, partial [Actinomycetota bacterium]|nr:nucleotide sugar dehydrogenase [Actinomycetota bacterium]
EDPAAAVSDADLTILVQNHKEYDVDALAGAARRFFDTRGVVSDGERVSRL